MPSFDIVSEINSEEVRNAVENASRELDTRYDFRGVDASFEYTKEETIVKAEADFQIQQLLDILRSNLAKRHVDAQAMERTDTVHSGKNFSVKVTFKQGIDSTIAKKLIKVIKDSKLKVQSAIQGEQVRVTGKKRDDLQSVMKLVKGAELGQSFQFNNFRD